VLRPDRQRYVQEVDPLSARHLLELVERPEDRKAAEAPAGLAGVVVQEPDDVEPELSVLRKLLRHRPTELAGARHDGAAAMA
jgi:hypothetical protein